MISTKITADISDSQALDDDFSKFIMEAFAKRDLDTDSQTVSKLQESWRIRIENLQDNLRRLEEHLGDSEAQTIRRFSRKTSKSSRVMKVAKKFQEDERKKVDDQQERERLQEEQLQAARKEHKLKMSGHWQDHAGKRYDELKDPERHMEKIYRQSKKKWDEKDILGYTSGEMYTEQGRYQYYLNLEPIKTDLIILNFNDELDEIERLNIIILELREKLSRAGDTEAQEKEIQRLLLIIKELKERLAEMPSGDGHHDLIKKLRLQIGELLKEKARLEKVNGELSAENEQLRIEKESDKSIEEIEFLKKKIFEQN
jgi:hypothetical protein